MSNICVFGGSGFLGSHVADQLTENGHSVRIFDLHKSKWIRKEQEFFKGDLLNFESVSDGVKDMDIVYNFAALSDLNEGLKKPIDTIKINILGNAFILDACIKNSIKRFIYASTVYVNSREGGFYKCSKQASEEYIQEYHKRYGLNYTILRYGSLYGPRSDIRNGLFRIVKNALDTGKVIYEGHPDSLREYIHVQDAANASIISLGDDFLNQSVVLTGQEPMRVADLLEMLAEIMNFETKIEFIKDDALSHYIRTPYAYNSKLGRKYIPPLHVDLGQGLLQLIEEIKSFSYEENYK